MKTMKPPNHKNDRGEHERKTPAQNALFRNEMKASVARGCAKTCHQGELNCVSPCFDAMKIDGSKRPLGDFTWVNAFADPPSFSMVSAWDICSEMRDGCWFGVWGKSKAFERLGLRRDDQPRAGTSCTENRKTAHFPSVENGWPRPIGGAPGFRDSGRRIAQFCTKNGGKGHASIPICRRRHCHAPKTTAKTKSGKENALLLKRNAGIRLEIIPRKILPKGWAVKNGNVWRIHS